MEEKKLDINSIIGFVLIFGILIWILYNNQSKPEEKDTKAKQEQVVTSGNADSESLQPSVTVADSTANAEQLANLKGVLGNFAYSATLPTSKENYTTIENDLLLLKIANKGGYIIEATVKKFEQFYKGSGELVKIIKDNNAHLNIELQTQDNHILNTKDLTFQPILTKEGENQVLTLRLKASENQFLEYRYVMKPNEYMLDFSIRSQGLNTVLNTSKPLNMVWDLKSYRNEKSVSYENRYTEVNYEYKNGKTSHVGQGDNKEENPTDVTYVAFKQHFFSSILLTDTPFTSAKLVSKNLVHDQEIDTVFTKDFSATIPLAVKGGELNYTMNWYYGPTDYKLLKEYKRNLDEIVPLGWGIFGWINRFIFIPVYSFLSGFIPHGIAIIIFTILVRLVMSPVTYKSYLSQAKMKIIRPEVNEINEKFKDPMKRQQETMKLYNKAGVSPMAGCLPALMQIPVFYALFQFFPSAVELRQKGFLWADDLSSYDAVINLSFYIPFYGNHVSLFPILASLAIFFYMKMTTGDQTMAQPQQEGMPDMGKIMKIMIYISPIMMLIFFNNYASGLSLYYFISNTITIGIMFVIKNYIVNDARLHAKIQENKAKPKKQNRFQRKMQEMMEQAEQQKNIKK